MKPVDFPESNTTFGPPEGYDTSQIQRIKGFQAEITEGNLDGDPVIMTCWELNEEELKQVMIEKKIFVTFLSHGLPPHLLTVSFNDSVNYR